MNPERTYESALLKLATMETPWETFTKRQKAGKRFAKEYQKIWMGKRDRQKIGED